MIDIKRIIRYFVVFFGLIGFLFGLLCLAFCIPDKLIEVHQETSLYIATEMESHFWFGNFFGKAESRLDGDTDRIMIKNVISEDASLSLFEKVAYINDYARYWHGYLVYLRPLMAFFNYWEIRYINMVVFYGLLAAVIAMLSNRFMGAKGIGIAFSFSLSIVMCYIVILAVSLQYYSVFLVMLISVVVVLVLRNIHDYPLLFLIVGVVTNFVDFLTVPIITLGMPLLVLLMLKYSEDNFGDARLFAKTKFVFFQCLAWAIGYAGCWIIKWCLAALILPNDITGSVTQHASFWLSDAGAGSRLWAYRVNMPYYFVGNGLKIAAFTLFVPLLFVILAILFHKKTEKPQITFLMVALLPYAWYFVFNGHSFYHAWFTFRAQAITLFGICLFFIEWIDFEQLRSVFRCMSLAERKSENDHGIVTEEQNPRRSREKQKTSNTLDP